MNIARWTEKRSKGYTEVTKILHLPVHTMKHLPIFYVFIGEESDKL